MEIKKSLDYPKNGVAILIYGIAGVGKTYLASHFPQPALFVDGGKGLLTLQQFKINMDYIKISKYTDILDTVEYINSCETGKYRTLIWDDLGSMAEAILDEIVSTKARSETASLIDYKLIVARLRTNLLNHLRTWRTKFEFTIVTTMVTSIQNPETGAVIGAPSVIGRKLPDIVPCLFDEVWRMEATSMGDKLQRNIMTVPEGFFVAESHLGLPNKLSPEELLEVLIKDKEE